MLEPESLTAALVARFADAAADTALVTVRSTGEPADGGTVSYAELDRRARALAAWLTARGAAGRPVLLALDTGPDLVTALLGCLFAGAVAVPVPPPDDSRAAAERTAAIVREAAVEIVLTETAHAAAVSRRLSEAGRGSLLCLALDAGLPDGLPEWSPPRLRPSDVALIQYTSGTTAAPRGVMVTHANLLATMAEIQRTLGTHRGSRIGGWLPCYHDLGLIGQLLHPLWLGATAVLMPPQLFVRRAVRWLQAIDRYGVTVAAAPDSAYARCTAEVTTEELAALDLSRWECAVNAAEPVSAATVEEFTGRFAAAGLRPDAMVAGYGLAEATLLVTGAGRGPVAVQDADPVALGKGGLRPAEPGTTARRLVGCGRPSGAEVRIVDRASRAELPEGAVGEVWVRGPAVAAGYWQRPLDTGETFGAVTAAGARGFLRTGDLGVLQDGELYLTGRIKEVLLVDGLTLHPQEVERRLLECGGQLASAAVFTAGADDHVVAVQEVRHAGRGGPDLPALADRIRRCLDEEFGAAAGGVLLVRPGTVRRTTSGKVRRSLMRELFLRGELRPLHMELDPSLAAVAEPAGAGKGAFR